MEATIVYFSQTGNTRKVAEAMAEEFERAGHKTTCLSLKNAKHAYLAKCDILGIGTPTFESHAPTPIKQYIKSLPRLDGQRSFVFATCGGAAGNVLHDLTKLLKKKGAEVVDGYLTLGEIHHPAPCIAGKSPDRPNAEDLNQAKRFASSMIQRMDSTQEMQHNGLNQKKGFYSLVGKVASSERLIRILEPKPKLDAMKCQQCQLCARECPMENITVDPNPVLGHTCIRCYRCVNVCKNKALSVNWWFGNLVILALWNKHFMHWFGEYDSNR